jgi:hypothetical protein
VKRKEALLEHLAKNGERYNCVLGIVPTGWTHERGSSAERIKILSDENLFLYKVDFFFSEHVWYLKNCFDLLLEKNQ